MESNFSPPQRKTRKASAPVPITSNLRMTEKKSTKTVAPLQDLEESKHEEIPYDQFADEAMTESTAVTNTMSKAGPVSDRFGAKLDSLLKAKKYNGPVGQNSLVHKNRLSGSIKGQNYRKKHSHTEPVMSLVGAEMNRLYRQGEHVQGEQAITRKTEITHSKYSLSQLMVPQISKTLPENWSKYAATVI